MAVQVMFLIGAVLPIARGDPRARSTAGKSVRFSRLRQARANASSAFCNGSTPPLPSIVTHGLIVPRGKESGFPSSLSFAVRRAARTLLLWAVYVAI